MKNLKKIFSGRSKLSVVATLVFLMFCLTYGFGYQKSRVKRVNTAKETYSGWNKMSREDFRALNRYADLDRTKRIQEHDDVDGRGALDSIRRGIR